MAETRDRIVAEAVQSSKDRGGRRLMFILAVLLLAFATYTIWSFQQFADNKDKKIETNQAQAAQGKSLAEEVREACQSSSVDTSQLGDLCKSANAVIEAVPGPAGDPGPKGQQGESGPPPSDSQVSRAVASYCSGGRCSGKNVTAAQVSAAVASYCNANGQCKGPSGSDGVDGKSGTDGSTGAKGDPGDPGPPPSDEQIATAVAAYCASNNGCKPDPIPADGVVTEGTCALTFNAPEGAPLGTVSGTIVLTIQQGLETRQVTIQC